MKSDDQMLLFWGLVRRVNGYSGKMRPLFPYALWFTATGGSVFKSQVLLILV